MEGDFNIDDSGNVFFKEEDGMDYAAVTVQLPGGERVPFLFTVKELVAKVPRSASCCVNGIVENPRLQEHRMITAGHP